MGSKSAVKLVGTARFDGCVKLDRMALTDTFGYHRMREADVIRQFGTDSHLYAWKFSGMAELPVARLLPHQGQKAPSHQPHVTSALLQHSWCIHGIRRGASWSHWSRCSIAALRATIACLHNPSSPGLHVHSRLAQMFTSFFMKDTMAIKTKAELQTMFNRPSPKEPPPTSAPTPQPPISC